MIHYSYSLKDKKAYALAGIAYTNTVGADNAKRQRSSARASAI